MQDLTQLLFKSVQLYLIGLKLTRVAKLNSIVLRALSSFLMVGLRSFMSIQKPLKPLKSPKQTDYVNSFHFISIIITQVLGLQFSTKSKLCLIAK